MSFLQLLLLFRSLPVRDLLNYPDNLGDVNDVRRWLVAVCEAGDALADLTSTTIDDTVVDAIKEVVNDATAFGVIYSIVRNIFDFGENYAEFREDVADAAAHVGMAPALIIAIIQIVVMVLKFIRDRRTG